MRTQMFRRQHDAAKELIAQICALSAGDIDSATAFQIGLVLAKLTGLLRIHFAQEDRSLYPLMAASDAQEAVALALQFQQEMGGLSRAYETFAERWRTSSAIISDPSGFQRESELVFRALANRIDRENTELYPLADGLSEGVRSAA